MIFFKKTLSLQSWCFYH